MNEPSAIQSQHAKWLEVILLWLGILIPIQTAPVVYQYLKWSYSMPEFLTNSLGIFLILTISLGLLLKYRTLSLWILRAPSTNLETLMGDSELSGWLTMGIFTFGLLFLVHTIPILLFSLGDILSRWFTPRQEALRMTGGKAWFTFVIFLLNYIPQLTLALFLTVIPKPLARWSISLQERWGSLNTETLQS